MLRPLSVKDISGMLEWLQDPEICQYFQFEVGEMDPAKALDFIHDAENLRKLNKTYHFAVVNEDDEYLGTVSLKNVDWKNLNGEYAISLRKAAQGTGLAQTATREILEYAFNILGLEKVYLNVLPMNQRAVKFYEKFGFVYEGRARKHVRVRGQWMDLLWYGILKERFKKSDN